MATIVVGAGNKVKPHRRCRVAYFPEAASQTFKAGDIVMNTGGTAGKVAIAESDVIAAGGDLILGVAAQEATGVTDTSLHVYLATEEAEFSANVQDTGTLALANIGTQYDIFYDTAASINIFRVDLADTTNPVLTVTELLDAVGDVNGRVVFKFMNIARAPHRS